MGKIRVTHITDPGCPWAYSAEPAITTLRWRYGGQLEWKGVAIGLTESGEEYERRGYTPELMAGNAIRFGRYGMPFATLPRKRVPGTGRACRAVVSARLESIDTARVALRALRFAWFTTDLLLDEDPAIAEALSRAPELDVDGIMSRIGSAEVEAAYQRDRAVARSAEGSPAQMQGKTARTDGPERYTAPTLIFETADGRRLEAGGFQPLAAYDVLIANLDPRLARRAPVTDPLGLLRELPYGLTTREIAMAMAERDDEPDDAAATEALVRLAARGTIEREPMGDDALWRPAAVAARAAA